MASSIRKTATQKIQLWCTRRHRGVWEWPWSCWWLWFPSFTQSKQSTLSTLASS